MVLMAGAGCDAGPEPIVIEPTPPRSVDARQLPESVSAAYRDLTAGSAQPGDRLAAARGLLRRGTPEAMRAIEAALAFEQPPAVHRAVFEAVAELNPMVTPATARARAAEADAPLPPLAPAAELVHTLLAMLGEVDPAVADALAGAISRWEDPAIRGYVAEQASSPQASVSVRADAARTLGRMRTPEAAATLMTLIDPGQPEVVRSAAFEALATATGRADLGEDRAAWAAWWAGAQRLSPEAWYRRLLTNFVRNQAARTQGRDHLEARLVESQGALYRTTSPEDRPAVLAYMLGDPLLPIRELAMELAVARLLDDQPFDEPLRRALRDRLTDDEAGLRARAALLLRDLADAPAAAMAARRLAEGREPATEARRAMLRLLGRLPQPEAVAPALAMLSEPELRGDAAGALAASFDAGHLSAEESRLAAERVRADLAPPGGEPPPPAVVTLLGKVGNDEDFDRIAAWVDSDNASVKRAAAQAWADSDKSLRLLAERADDPTIAPIVIDAATRRGDDPWTLRALMERPPERGQLRAAWERALVAMAGRTPAASVLELLPTLDKAGADLTLRDRVLSAALSADGDDSGSPDAAAEAQVDAPTRATLASLRLERGETRLALREPAAAIEDFERLGQAHDLLDDRQADRLGRGWIRAALALGRYDQAFDVAGGLLGESQPTDVLGPTDDPIVDLFVEAAKRQAQLGQRDQARQILRRLRSLLGPRIKPEVAQRIALVEATLGMEPKSVEVEVVEEAETVPDPS